MGCDIHYAIEVQDESGTWYPLYLSGLFYTAWWQSKFMKGMDKFRDDPHGLDALRDRDYYLFNVLSGVRGSNPFEGVLGEEDGVLRRGEKGADFGFPNNASPLVVENMGENIDCHSHGWMTGTDLLRVKDDLERLPKNLREEYSVHYTSAVSFVARALTIMDLLAGANGKPGLVGLPICQVPGEYGYDDPDFPATSGGNISHHQIMTVAAMLRTGDGVPLERLRILICYDN